MKYERKTKDKPVINRGILDDPLSPAPPLSWPRKFQRAYNKSHKSELEERYRAFFSHFGQKYPKQRLPQSVFVVIQKLATEAGYKAFTEDYITKQKAKGQPGKWTGYEGMLLWKRVQDVKKDKPQISNWNAVSKVHAKFTKDYVQYTKKTLAQRYQEVFKLSQKWDNITLELAENIELLQEEVKKLSA